MTEAPLCRAEKPCGPFGLPGHPEGGDGWQGWVHCVVCEYLWDSDEDYALAVRAQDEYLALEGVKESQERQDERAYADSNALVEWEKWAKQPWPGQRRLRVVR